MVELTTKQQVLLATFSNVTQSLTEQFCTRLVLKNIFLLEAYCGSTHFSELHVCVMT